MARTAAEYHAIAKGIRDIYIQELTPPGGQPRIPDEGGWIEWFHHVIEEGHDLNWVRDRIKESGEWKAVHENPNPQPTGKVLPRLVPAGHVFKLETGQRFTVIGCSDFNLLCSYLIIGERYVRSIMEERATIGFNWLRVWTAYWDTNTMQGIPGIGELNPAKEPGVYAALKPFCALAAEYGLYVEFTAFTGPAIPGHWEKIGAALQGVTNVAVELCNENDAHAVRIDPNAYQPLPGILCSHGSNGSQALPPRPPWGYEVMHHVGVYQFARKVGHNTMELSLGAEGIAASHVPAISNENTRPDQDSNVNHFFDAAAGAALLCGGSVFHSNSGKASFSFSAQDRPFAEAWVAGAKSVPLDYQHQPYKHRSDLEGPNAGATGERVYQRGDSPTVRIRP